MLESRIIYLLNKVLEPYIGGIDQNTLHWNNLLRGRVVLNGLHLKPCIVDYLSLPFHLTFGLIDQVSIKVHLPLLSLSKRKLVIEISDVILLLTVIPETQWDPHAYREEHVAQKIATLAAESLQLVVKEIEGGGFFWKTLVSFLENLEVVINNIHIRVEDYTTNPNVSYAFGCVVKSAVFMTDGISSPHADDTNVDTPFRKAFYKDDGTLNPSVIHRDINLTGVGFYINRLDPLRPCMMHNDNTVDEVSRSKTPNHVNSTENGSALTGSIDNASFMDAISYGHASHNTCNSGGLYQGAIVARMVRHDRMRYMASQKRRPLRKAFRVKNRRSDGNSRYRFRYIRYMAERSGEGLFVYQRQLNVLLSNSHVYSCIVSRIMNYLSTGKHSDGCDCPSNNGWYHNSTVPQQGFEDINGDRAASVGNGVFEGTVLDGLLQTMKGPYDPHKSMRQSLRSDPSVNKWRHRSPTMNALKYCMTSPTNQRNQVGDDSIYGEHGVSAKGKHDNETSMDTDAGNFVSNSLGYNISSSSSWRILLSTFCDIQQPSDVYPQDSMDMIHQAQMRYQQRMAVKNPSNCDNNSSVHSAEQASESSLNEVTMDRAEGTEVMSDPTTNQQEDVETSSPTGAARVYCPPSDDIDCSKSDESDSFNKHAFKSYMASPFSYDETWHVYNHPAEPVTPSSVAAAPEYSPERGNMSHLPTEVPTEKHVCNKADIWTRFTFVMNRNEDMSLKELFLRTMEETAYNYILNPQEFNGVASFYLCIYPTPPYGKPHSCWSVWGRERESKFQKDRVSTSKDFLPRCSVFVALQNMNIVLSKDQYDCLMNLIFENIMKYMSWQSGIIYTFENPRASKDDEKLYMEYWPQYLLLGQSNKNNELRQFIKDFEILHSMQVIRILRNNVSEALRDLIHRFSDDRGFGYCDGGMNECISDVLFTNICKQFDYDEDDGASVKSRQDDGSKLQAHLRLVGGIYEIVTKHAKTTTFLDSLRKIYQPAVLIYDVVLDFSLVNSRVSFLFDTESYEESNCSAKAYMLSSNGVHFFMSDVYGRDGYQFMEIELLPFSLVTFGFTINAQDVEFHGLTDCACALLEGPATLLLSCYDVESSSIPPPPSEPSNQSMSGFDKLKALKRDFALGFGAKQDRKPISVKNSSLYLAMSFNRFCTPEDADMRVLLHLNCDVFGHVRLLDEFRDYLRMKKYSMRHHDTLNPLLVGENKKRHDLLYDPDRLYRECYQLIDLGLEYSKNLLQGPIPFMNLDFFIEENQQTVLYVDVGSSVQTMPYFVCVDSIAVASEITPRLLDSPEKSSYDSHIIRLSNLRIIRVNGDYSFMGDGGRRSIYLGEPSTMQLCNYLDLVARVELPPGCDDPAVSSLLSEFQKNFEMLRIGSDSDVFIKVKCANSNYSGRNSSNTVITVAMNSMYLSVREHDVLDFITSYWDYVMISNDYTAFKGCYNNGLDERLQGSCDGPSKLNHISRSSLREGLRGNCSVASDYRSGRDYLMNFRALVNQKWLSLQQMIHQHKDPAYVMYEYKVDYIFFELRRHIHLATGNHGASSFIAQANWSRYTSMSYSPRSQQSHGTAAYSSGTSTMGRNDFGNVQPVDVGSSLSRRFMASIERHQTNRVIDETYSIHDPDDTTSRNVVMSCIQDAITKCGITLPLVSLKLTGIGVRVASSDRRIETMRLSLGCIELEDQTNSLPIYTSTVFVGGDSIAFWRWLKVRREVNLVRSCLESYCDDLNISMKQLSKKSANGSSVRISRNDPMIRKGLCHIDYSSIRFDHRLTHDYVEKPFFTLKGVDDKITKAYLDIEKYLDSVMNCDIVVDNNVMRNDLHSGKVSCFISGSLDYDEYDNGKCVLNISNAMLNVAWEVIHEVSSIVLRIWEYMANVPPMATQEGNLPSSAAPPRGEASGRSTSNCERWCIDTTVNLEQSCINLMCDSAWVGYANFMKYMWSRLLSNVFSIADQGSVTTSRLNSIAEANDARSSIYLPAKEQALQRGHHIYKGQTLSNFQVVEKHRGGKKLSILEKPRESQPRLYSKELNISVGASHPIGVGRGFNGLIRWEFVRFVLKDPYCKAYLIGPIYMHLSGRGCLSLSFCSSPKEHSTIKDITSRGDRCSALRHSKLVLSALAKSYSSYLPCTIQLHVRGSNISAGFTREFSGNVLSTCGFQTILSDGPSYVKEALKRQRLEFLKYIRSHSRRDNKFIGLLELSKETLYDSSQPMSSLFIEPLRFEISCGTRLHGCDFLNRKYSIPQCVCVSMHFEAVKARFNCVDVLCFCNLLGLVSECIIVQNDEDPFYTATTRMETNEPSHSMLIPSVEGPTSAKNDVEYGNTIIDDFHSCNSSDSEVDWMSVDSSDDDDDHSNQVPPSKGTTEKSRIGKNVNKSLADLDTEIELLDELLSFFNFGCDIKFDLIYIELSSHVTGDIKNVFTVTLEDIRFMLWSNRTSALLNRISMNKGDTTGNPHNNADINEMESDLSYLMTVSDSYTPEIEDRMAFCSAVIDNLLSRGRNGSRLSSSVRKSHLMQLLYGDISELAEGFFGRSDMSNKLLRFESHLCLTVGICTGSRHELVIEPVQICFRGTKPSVYSKTLTSLNTSWINTNISLNGAQCIFGFLKYVTELGKLRTALVETQRNDFFSFQPAIVCSLDTAINTTMIPQSMLPVSFQMYRQELNPPRHPVTDPYLPITNIPAALAFRIKNNMICGSGYLDIHGCLISSLKSLASLKMDGAASSGTCGGLSIGPVVDTFGASTTAHGDKGAGKHSYLFNTLGQPIAVYFHRQAIQNADKDDKWRIIEDGEKCILPLGYYGLLLPFVVRIQVNNCVYEIPSSMLDLTHKDEFVFRLDISERRPRDHRVTNRIGFLTNLQHGRFKNQKYRFGLLESCVHTVDNDFGKEKSFRKGISGSVHRTGSYNKDLGVRFLRRVWKTKLRMGTSLGPSSRSQFKYAYVMVRTVQHLGALEASSGAAMSHFSIYISSTLWISNKSKENLVVFPSVGIDAQSRLVPSSSLVWLLQHDPVTSSVPLAQSTVESNGVIAGVKSVGNQLIKQLANIQDSKQSVKRIHPSHVLNPMQLNGVIENMVPEFKLQYLVIKEFPYNQQGVPIPLSWTIERSCTIGACLQEDFPVDISVPNWDSVMERLDKKGLEFYEDLPPHFTGDVLLSSSSAQYLSESFEQPKLKLPIPCYSAKISVGHLDGEDILASELKTGFVQDITVGGIKSKGPLTARQQPLRPKRARSIASSRSQSVSEREPYRDDSMKVVSRNISRPSTAVNPSEMATLNAAAIRPLGSGFELHDKADTDSASLITAESAPAVIIGATDVPSARSINSEHPQDDDGSGFKVLSKTVARLSTTSPKASSTPSCSISMKRRTWLSHASWLRLSRASDNDLMDNVSHAEFEQVIVPPKVILSSTLIEVSAPSRSGIGVKSGRAGVKYYEISLESCHVIENMMPFDIHIINPATFERLSASRSKQNDLENRDPIFYPVPIKASNRAQFSWYMRNGRVVIKDLLSREFTVKMPTERVVVSSLVFETMQPNLFEEFCRLSDPLVTDAAMMSHHTLPRRMVVSVETSRKSMEPIKDKNGVVSRFLASSQIVYTIFADNWIISCLNYPISLCRGDGRGKQTISAQNCTLVSQDLSSTNLQLAIRKSTLKQISNFANYPKRAKSRFLSFDNPGDTHVMSNTFTLPDFAFSTCDFSDTVDCPRLHYVVSTSMPPPPFFRTSVLMILPQTTLTNEFSHPLWLRETDSYKTNGYNSGGSSCGWYVIDPGETLEFHSQVKGELTIEITGIDPHSLDHQLSDLSAGETSEFHIWSSGIALKPSHLTQFRYPSACHVTKRYESTENDVKRSSETNAAGRHQTGVKSIARTLRYGLCEVEVRMHRGAKMVRFMSPKNADWILLNTTGIDLWVEQHGVPGYGELVPTVGMQSRIISADYAGHGVPFACYDPFKEHKLVCRLHLTPSAFKVLSGVNSKGVRRTNEPSVGLSRWTQPMTLLTSLPLGNVINNRVGRALRMKGSLIINLSRVESMKCSSVFEVRCGGSMLSVRLTAQTTVLFGQKTLHFTAVHLPFRAFPRLQHIRPTNLLNIYSELKNKLHAPRNIGYALKSGAMVTGTRVKGSFRRLVSSGLYLNKKSPFSTPHTSRYVDATRFSFNARRTTSVMQRNFDTAPIAHAAPAKIEGFINWDYVFQVNVLGLGTAICSSINKEILYISGTLIKFMVTLDKDEYSFALSLGWIQSDVHDPSTCYPTMIRPLASWHLPIHNYDSKKRWITRNRRQTDKSGDEHKEEPHVLTIKFSTISNKYFSLKEITNCRIELEPLRLNLDTRIGHSILMLVDEYMSIFGLSGATSEYFTTVDLGIFSNVDTWLRNFDITQYPLKEVARSQFSNSLGSGTRYNISNLYVGKITLAINIRRSVSRLSSDIQPQNLMIRYLMHIVRRTPHISDANIILSQESLLELCCTPYALMSHFTMRYITQSVQQIYKVLGAVDLIGNPKIVLHHWLTGCQHAMSLLRESLQYVHVPPIMVYFWVRSASRIGASFVCGIVDAFYRLTGSWYLLFNTLACNADRYAVVILQDTFRSSMNQPSNLMEGVLFGGRAFGRNLYASLGNFALKPLRQLVRTCNSIKNAKTVNSDVLLSGLHVLGSMFSSLASLTFGTVSSMLSGVSVISQGLLNQIHSVPMLSAIRPQRSVKALKSSGPIRYNFLESWSMNASRHLKTVNELLLLLPMDGKVKLFDPLYAATLHWSALSDHMGKISPIDVCRPSSSLSTFFWINRTHMGFLDRRKLRWRCENRNIRSIEIYRVPVTGHQCPNIACYDDSIVVNMQPKTVKKHFSVQDTYYLRIVYVASASGQVVRKGSRNIPAPLLKGLMNASTFPIDENPREKSRGICRMQSIREEPNSSMSDGGCMALGAESLRCQGNALPIHRFYQDNIDPLSLELCGITIDKMERSSDPIEDVYSQTPQGLNMSRVCDLTTYDNDEDVPMSFDSGNATDSNANNSPHVQHNQHRGDAAEVRNQTAKMAEVMRLPNVETARLYFTLIVSVLKEATL